MSSCLVCANINIREIMLISIISSASWSLLGGGGGGGGRECGFFMLWM